MKKKGNKKSEKFGTVLGCAPGNVPVYSSDYGTVDKERLPTRHTFRSYVDGIFMGYKWQCVEFARRWLYLNRGFVFDDIAMAYDIFRLKSVRVVKDGAVLPLHSFANGSARLPEPGCLLIWNEGGEFADAGHVAVVTEVFPDRIRFVEQNVEHELWPAGQNYSRELRAKEDENGGYWIECFYSGATILGWVIQTGDPQGAEIFPDLDIELLNLQAREVKNRGQANRSWLNVANPDEAAYVAVQGHKVTDRKDKEYKYFCISESAYGELKRATNQLHSMFMHATDYVLQNEAVLERFCIPRPLWSRLRRSWDNRRNQAITGRLDFSVSENGIKIYEYNADSAACYMECGVIQTKWSKHFGCKEGWCAGEKLHRELVDAWKDSEVDGILHIMRDNDREEAYHALFMKAAIEQAGIECRVITGCRGLSWDADGRVIDSAGVPIRWVWKTWAWETALDQIRAECDEDDTREPQSLLRGPARGAPRLVDVLLGEDVLVFEPLWTLIPSNKAILPVLWTLYPGHPYLLDSQFELTAELRGKGFVAKPIVGRCGANISIFSKDDSLVSRTGGQFEKREQIYQEFFPLPKIDGDNVQVGTFPVSGVFAGANVRMDPSLILVSDSDMPALRVVNDEALLDGGRLRGS
ncbi:MAG: bifunctional glutathionylspermidine amidase/synthase [Elusimicrobiota bacterium]